MVNYLDEINKENQYFKLYIRMLKEKNLFKDKRYLSNERYNYFIFKGYDIDSLMFNMQIPNMLIDKNLNYKLYYDLHCEYMRKIAKNIIALVLKELSKTTIIEKIAKLSTEALISIIFSEFKKEMHRDKIPTSSMLPKSMTKVLRNYIIIDEMNIRNIMNTTISIDFKEKL